MPESVLLEKILPGRKLTDEEWLLLIHERADLVGMFMDRVRLTKLCEFGYAPSDLGGGCTVSISGLRDQRTIVTDDSLDYRTEEGIFRSICSRDETDSHRHFVLGFTRAGHWLVADILEVSRNYRRFIDTINVRPVKPEDVVKRFHISYRQILAFLADEYTGWLEKKREIFERMQRFQSKFAVDDRIIDALCAKPKEQER